MPRAQAEIDMNAKNQRVTVGSHIRILMSQFHRVVKAEGLDRLQFQFYRSVTLRCQLGMGCVSSLQAGGIALC